MRHVTIENGYFVRATNDGFVDRAQRRGRVQKSPPPRTHILFFNRQLRINICATFVSHVRDDVSSSLSSRSLVRFLQILIINNNLCPIDISYIVCPPPFPFLVSFVIDVLGPYYKLLFEFHPHSVSYGYIILYNRSLYGNLSCKHPFTLKHAHVYCFVIQRLCE